MNEGDSFKALGLRLLGVVLILLGGACTLFLFVALTGIHLEGSETLLFMLLTAVGASLIGLGFWLFDRANKVERPPGPPGPPES